MHNLKIITFGCRLNTLESELIKKNARLSNLSESRDVFIFNTCAVTAEAERQIGQSIRKYRKDNPDAIFIVCGCSANASYNKYNDMDYVDFVLGNKEKTNIQFYKKIKEDIMNGEKNKVYVQDLKNNKIDLESDYSDFEIQNFEGRTRAFIQIQQGCRNNCSFCIVPNLRGRSVSLSKEQIFNQIKSVVENGYKEIVLTGVDIASYNADSLSIKPLTDLVKDILKEFKQIKRIRFSSLDPACDYTDLIQLAKHNKKIMPHFHFSLQHASDDVLRNMRRRHTGKQFLNLCYKIKEQLGNHVAIGADVITGFPNETETDFKILLKTIKKARVSHIHTFVYSPRPGTFAGDNMKDNVDKQIAKTRAKTLRKIADKNLKHLLKISVGKIKQVLIEGDGKHGYTENYIKCNITDEVFNENDIVNVKIESQIFKSGDSLELKGKHYKGNRRKYLIEE